MEIIKEITIDLSDHGVAQIVDVMQMDENVRKVAVTLCADGRQFIPDADASISVAFEKPDRTAGWYDTLPDGTPAASVSGNVVTVTLVPEMMTVFGRVHAVIVFQSGDLSSQISSFPFLVSVVKNPSVGQVISSNYYNLQTLAQINAAYDSLKETVDGMVSDLGDISAALDNIIALQESYIGGESA